MRLLTARLLAAVSALTWLVFPGFGLVDLSVTWDPDWPVVLAPRRTAPAQATLLVTLATWLVATVAGLEWPLLFFVGVLVVEAGLVAALLPERERLRPLARSVSIPLVGVSALGVLPWLVHAERMFADNRRDAGVIIGDVTMGVDHYAVQGALALALPTLALLAAVWPRGRRHLGVGVGRCAGYVGVVSYAFPATWGGLGPLESALCVGWAVAVALLAVLTRLQVGEFRGEVVEAERAL